MRFQHTIEQVYFRPWLITAEGWHAVERVISSHLLEPERLGAALDRRAERPGEDYFGDALPQARIEDGVGIIPIHGTILNRASMLEKSCGAVDAGDIRDELAAFNANDSVRAIVLDIASPGGTVSGVPELADAIAASGKKVVAFADDLIASAAYWLGAGASRLLVSPSATVGSIGVYMAFLDKKKMYDDAGVKVELIKAGKFKAAGYPGTSLSDEQRELLQAGVDATHAEFKAFVRSHRRKASEETMEGQTFSGKQAVANKLATGIAHSLGEAVAYARKLTQKPN